MCHSTLLLCAGNNNYLCLLLAAIAFFIIGLMYIRMIYKNHSPNKSADRLRKHGSWTENKKTVFAWSKGKKFQTSTKPGTHWINRLCCFLDFSEGKKFNLQEAIGIMYFRYQ